MRILFVLDCKKTGGAERHTLGLARAFAASGHTVETVVLMAGGSEHFPAASYPLAPREIGSVGPGPKMALKLAAIYNDVRPDVVFAINQTSTVAAWIARVFASHRPKVASIFHTTVLSTFGGRIKLPVYRYCVAKIDGLIFVSHNQRTYWHRRGLVGALDVAIPNGIDVSRFPPPNSDERTEARARNGLGDDDFVLTICARFAPEKNHLQLVEALVRLASEIPNLRLLFVGDGPTRAEVAARVAEVGLVERVVFTGERASVRSELCAADVGVLVSNAVETFSIAALELMALGLPVILSDIGGASEMVTPGLNGELFPVGDTVALCDRIRRLTDHERREAMGQRAREVVMSRYTEGLMMKAYYEVLSALRTATRGETDTDRTNGTYGHVS